MWSSRERPFPSLSICSNAGVAAVIQSSILPLNFTTRCLRIRVRALFCNYVPGKYSSDLDSRARDEEPLVDRGIDWSRSKVLSLGHLNRVGRYAFGRVLDMGVFAGQESIAGYASADEWAYMETPPGCVLPVMSFSHASAHSRTMSVAYLDRNMRHDT